jgi:hypothetical protein
MSRQDMDALAEGPQPDLARWRRLALVACSAIDMALDVTPAEARPILLEAAPEFEGGMQELDALGMATEGRAA